MHQRNPYSRLLAYLLACLAACLPVPGARSPFHGLWRPQKACTVASRPTTEPS